MVAQVVIGGNAGDEGKGVMTNHLFGIMGRGSPALNIRFNGGSQAGHTVNGHKSFNHVFHHFGSGSFHNYVETFLSEDFICNPLSFERELKELHSKNIYPRVYVDAKALITTPYDMMINQMLEETRGSNRHGSCGLGINETIVRSEIPNYRLSVNDIRKVDHETGKPFGLYQAKKIMRTIAKEYVPQRISELGIEVNEKWKTRLESNDIFMNFIQLLICFNYNTHIVDYYPNFIRQYDPNRIVFEGAQGLLLDQEHKFFPHVTRSNTGIKNVVKIASMSRLDALDVIYMTRPYLTRHGAGPMPTEVKGMHFKDATNIPNDWQGTIRFGMLDIDLLAESIEHDLTHAFGHPIAGNMSHGVGITCLDQIKDGVDYVVDGEVHHGGEQEIIKAIRSKGLDVFYTGRWEEIYESMFYNIIDNVRQT